MWAGFFFGGVYIAVILLMAVSWYFSKDRTNICFNKQESFISVIIPFRNEIDCLPDLLLALQNQNLDSDLFEVIAVNDHSTDEGEQFIKEQTIFRGNLVLVNSEASGKKNALKEGILKAKGDFIATIDADCIAHVGWLSYIKAYFDNGQADMLIGPVKMLRSASFLSYFESIDFYSLQMSGASCAMLGNPVFCSGANLAFKKDYWYEAEKNSAGKNKESGDDVFLLHAFKKLKRKIVFINHPHAMVSTETTGSFLAFFRQRVRWGGKTTSYKDIPAIVLASIVFMANLSVLIFLFLWILGKMSIFYFILLFCSKMFADYLLLMQGRNFFDVYYPFYMHLLFSLLYPLVLVATAFGGMLLPERWK